MKLPTSSWLHEMTQDELIALLNARLEASARCEQRLNAAIAAAHEANAKARFTAEGVEEVMAVLRERITRQAEDGR